MKVTSNAVIGECRALIKHYGWPIEKEYLKEFYTRKFAVAVARQMRHECNEYTVQLVEHSEAYVLRVH